MIPFIKSFNIHPSALDNVPNAVDWVGIEWSISNSSCPVTSQQITGISSSINLFISEAVTSPDLELYYRVDNSEVTGNITSQPGSPWIQVQGGSGTTFSVNNNQWVSFVCYTSSTSDIAATTMTVINKSNNDNPLDTFTIRAKV